MEIRVITDQKQWDEWLVARAENSPFTQSWAWGDILIAEGKKVERLAVVENGDRVALAQVVYSDIFFGWQYGFCPKGPVIDGTSIKNNEERIYVSLVDYFNKKQILFLRIEPDSIIPNSKFQIRHTIDINPSATLLLDLTKTEEELLASMHPKVRYNLRLAEKKNLEIRNEKNLGVFWNLMNKTGSRDKFGLHSKKHYEQVLYSPIISQYTAYLGDVPVACAVFVRFGNTFTYLYGASDYEYRNLMAPYLLQWKGFQTGKSLGCTKYDFFGVAPRCHSEQVEESLSQLPNRQGSFGVLTHQDDKNAGEYVYNPKHQYAGVTRFKLGFGGQSEQAPGTYDLVIDIKKYLVYNLLRKLRRLF